MRTYVTHGRGEKEEKGRGEGGEGETLLINMPRVAGVYFTGRGNIWTPYFNLVISMIPAECTIYCMFTCVVVHFLRTTKAITLLPYKSNRTAFLI